MNYSYNYSGGGAAAVFFTLVWIAFAVLTIVGLWRTLSKAGLPGWAAIIPFYNEYNVVKMSNRPVSWFWIMLVCSLLAWIPFIGWLLLIVIFVLWVFIALDIAANFGQGTGFAILLIIFPWIMFLILGFGGYEYRRIAAPGSAGFGAPPMPAGGGYTAVPPAPPAPPTTSTAAPQAPVTTPAAAAAPATPPVTQPTTPSAPVTPPAKPAEAAPAAETAASDATETAETAAAETSEPEPKAAPPEAPSAPDAPPAAPPSSSPPPPPPLI